MINDAQIKTLEAKRHGEVFGLLYQSDNDGGCWIDTQAPQLLRDDEGEDGGICGDEAAYGLMVIRGLEALGKKWTQAWPGVMEELMNQMYEAGKPIDILAAIIAAIGDET